MDQIMAETIVTLHPDVLFASQATTALRRLMCHYAEIRPASYWAAMVSVPVWREQRPDVIRTIAERDWITEANEIDALKFAELTVLAVEACAGQWRPEQCRLSAVRIDGKHTMSLICSMEGCSR